MLKQNIDIFMFNMTLNCCCHRQWLERNVNHVEKPAERSGSELGRPVNNDAGTVVYRGPVRALCKRTSQPPALRRRDFT